MFEAWPANWGYFGEEIDFVEEMINLFMTNKIFVQFVDAKIVFMETKDKYFFLSLHDIPGECPMTKDEHMLLQYYIKHAKIKKVYTTKIEYKKVFLPDNQVKEIRENLCEWYAFYEVCQLIEHHGQNKIVLDEVVNRYIQSLEKIQEKHSLKFVSSLVTSLKKCIQ